LVSTILIYFLIVAFPHQARANPVPRPDPHPESLEPLVFIVSEACGFIIGVSILIFGAKEEDGRRVARTIMLVIIISYVPAYIIWQTIYNSGILPRSSFLFRTVVFILTPEILGTVLGTVFLKKVLAVKWTWAFLTMGALMLSSFLVGELIYASV